MLHEAKYPSTVGIGIVTQPAFYIADLKLTTCNFTGFRQVWGPCRCFDSRYERRGAKCRFRELDRAIWRAEDSWDELNLELKAFHVRSLSESNGTPKASIVFQ